MLIIDEFNFELAELIAKFICAKRGKDPSATNNTGNQEWVAFLAEAELYIGVFRLCEKACGAQVHQRIVRNGHAEDAVVTG